ncbi:hypothetical protein [Moraxella lacunata]
MFDRTTIKLHFFLEKRAIFLIFHCKYKRQACPTYKMTTNKAFYLKKLSL